MSILHVYVLLNFLGFRVSALTFFPQFYLSFRVSACSLLGTGPSLPFILDGSSWDLISALGVVHLGCLPLSRSMYMVFSISDEASMAETHVRYS